jgi:O-antigen/teichoic acid export membrane protein
LLKKYISLNFLSQIINLITGFASSILLARVLGPEGRGDYILVLTSVGFLVQFFTFGIESSITHFVASGKIKHSRLLFSIIVYVIFLSLLLIMGTILVSYFTKRVLIPAQNIHYYIVLILLVLFTFLENVLISLLNGVKAFRSVIVTSICFNIFILLTALVFFIFFKGQPDLAIPLLYATAVVHFGITLAYIYSYVHSRQIELQRTLLKKDELKQFALYSLISFTGSVLQYLNYKMDFWVVNYYWGSANLGIYSLAASLSQLLWIFPQSIATIMFPMTSYFQRAELTNITERLTRSSVFITLIIVIPIFALSPFFIPLLFGKAFASSVFYFQLFLFGVFPFIVMKVLGSVFAGIGKVKYNLYCTITGFVGGAIAYLTLIPTLGLTGGVIGSIISYVLATSVGVFLYRKEFLSPIMDLLIVKRTDISFLSAQMKRVVSRVKG